ncbi:chloramphenicol acetyltransferase [Hymenobacter weizhouensis]|uniref:chloramphenicol acetyltransferase n=1 Tax=Hymenobacter sp. YIM 151500-1 TaxID=2987689 RepID=UPI002227BBD9|nr:chloramphenicol acetyltransferase [Hymenobacter sp. YIM 151500-1]UYZ63936.1 chloramphenicol acetyltransferase [Hymenobacter sp. YIM 151500-1]
MKQQIDLATWNRREHFAFFSGFDEPFFGLVAPVDCTQALAEAKRLGVSFFFYYLYHSLRAANQVPEFRYRIEDGQVYCYDRVHASATIGRPDHTFGFSFIELHDTLADFVAAATAEVAAVQASSGLRLTETTARPDVVHCSALPWVRFSGLTHARSFRHADSCPKISYGQTYAENGATWLPVAVNVHHGLADGYHVGQFLTAFQAGLNGE